MSQIGRYEVVKHTGNHGLGSLYQAFDPVMHRPVMIRIADGSDQARQAILVDAKQLAHLDHPNIIKFLACEEDDGRPFLVMERFDGKPLTGKLPPDRLSMVLKKAALALDHANSRGLIHRNLTPESLLLDAEGELKVTGFEIARPAQYLNSESDQDLDLLLDSIHYMSPELVQGDALDARSDQYSLGVIAWQALTGALPFRADSPITLLSNIAFDPPDLNGAPAPLIKTFERVLAKSPADRFASASEFASAFRTATPGSGALPARPTPREPTQSLVPWILAAALLVAIIITAAILITRPRPTPPQPSAAPQTIPSPPPPVVTAPSPVAKPKPKLAKKAATKDTTPPAPKLKPIDPKVVHQ
jgi:eukaryotic-like serine/threonine-protein kinase